MQKCYRFQIDIMNFWNHLRTSFKSVPLSVGPSNWYIRVSLAHGLLVLSRQTYVLPGQTLVLSRQTYFLPRQTLVLLRQTLVSSRQTYVLPRQTLVLPRNALVLPRQTFVLPRDTIVLLKHTQLLPRTTSVLSRQTVVLPSDRHLKHNGSKMSIAKDREFVKCRQVLDWKARALCEKGHGKRPYATKALTVQDKEQLWKNRVLGQKKSKVTPLHSVASAHALFSSSRLPRVLWNVCRRFQLEQGRPRHRVRNI